MALDEQGIETLVTLGLNITQAKVYLALLNLGRARAKTVWKCSKVARQDIYRILIELENKSLVEKIIDTPAEFRALPLQTCMSTLLEEKRNEYDGIKRKTEEFVGRFEEKQKKPASAKEFEIKLISTNEAYLRRLKDAAVTTQKSIDIIDSFEHTLYRAVNDSDLISSLLRRNVKFRLITNHPGKGRCLPEVYRKNLRSIQVRFVHKEPIATLRIDDKKQVSVSVITPIRKPVETPRLFSDSPCLVALLEDYFEHIWREAFEDESSWKTYRPLQTKPYAEKLKSDVHEQADTKP
ncbi:MAG: TrmB family transcriptional regulator [Candidatus Bathyarchaeia archaeon]|jgi:sugar-specific transcriptional regulator TrmB